MNVKLLFAMFLVFFLSGCVGTLLQPVALNATDLSQIRASGTIAVSKQVTPGFMFNTPAGALVDAGSATWIDPSTAPSWPRIADHHGVPDFTDSISEKFVSALSDALGPLNFEGEGARQPYSAKEEVAYVEQIAADYVLEFRTHYGSFHYLPLHWKTYAMNYTGQARLIRRDDQAVIWKSTCTVAAGDDPTLKVPLNDFIAGSGDLLRSAASYVTDNCSKQLLSEFLQAG